MHQKIKIGILLFLTFLVCIGIGIYIYKIENISDMQEGKVSDLTGFKITDECTKEAEELTLVNGAQKKVSPNTVFIMKTKYTKCGHTIKKYETAPSYTVNLTQKELEKMYEDWKIETFSNKEIVMQKEVNSICDEHFVLRNCEGEITIFRVDENNNEHLINKTGIIEKYLPDSDKDKIKEGLFVNGKEALNKILENYE